MNLAIVSPRLVLAASAAAILLAGPVLVAQDTTAPPPATVADPPVDDAISTIVDSAHIDVVFVLDTTGSMSGLIEGAKQKIWAIANAIATAEPTPEVRIGLVGYRDRGDAYVTKMIDLTDDLDLVYGELLSFQAQGGGDTPESVNQALHEAVTKMQWSEGDETLKLVYLVGDAPPHMDYEDDVKYGDTCTLAAESGLIINTIQCGAMSETAPIWQAIARGAEGEYFAIAQSGGMVVVATPYDEELSELGTELTGTVVSYGSAEAQLAQTVRAERCGEIDAAAPAGAKASRAVWNACDYGRDNLTGGQELLADIEAGRVELAAIEEEQLPEELKDLDGPGREKWVQERLARRKQLQHRIQDLGRQRDQFLKENAGADADAFDTKVVETLRRQAADKGIEYKDVEETKADDTETETDETKTDS